MAAVMVVPAPVIGAAAVGTTKVTMDPLVAAIGAAAVLEEGTITMAVVVVVGGAKTEATADKVAAAAAAVIGLTGSPAHQRGAIGSKTNTEAAAAAAIGARKTSAARTAIAEVVALRGITRTPMHSPPEAE